MGCFRNGVIRPRLSVFRPHSWGYFTTRRSTSIWRVFASFMGFGFRRTGFIHGVGFHNAHSTSFSRHSASFMGFVFASWRSTSEKHCDTVETPVETSALWAAQSVGFRWQPAWQPHVWQPPELVTIGGNQRGNRLLGNLGKWQQ